MPTTVVFGMTLDTGILDKKVVLVLNRNWQAVNTITPAEAFCRMSTDSAIGLDIAGLDAMSPTPWQRWLELDVRDDDFSIRTVRGRIRVPTVVVLSTYTKVPMKRPKLSSRAIRERDGGRCQYTGKKIAPNEGNIDHIIPRVKGGETSWTNCVYASRNVNSKKGGRTPEEAGLSLIRDPESPRMVPITFLLKNVHDIEDWKPFLGKGG